MSVDDRVTRALHQVADEVVVPRVDVGSVRSAARAHRVRALSITATAAATVVLLAAAAFIGGRDTSAPEPAGTTPARPSSTSTREPELLTYTSSQYDLTLQYPRNWTPVAAERAWSWSVDAKDAFSHAADWFMAPESSHGDVRLSVWNAPIDATTRVESYAYLVAFAEDYCEKSGASPCTGIAERATQLCVEPRDCHPGLLVPFKEDVQAFVSGGNFADDAVTILALWRSDEHESVAAYGGGTALLEAFLETMDVRPRPGPTGS